MCCDKLFSILDPSPTTSAIQSGTTRSSSKNSDGSNNNKNNDTNNNKCVAAVAPSKEPELSSRNNNNNNNDSSTNNNNKNKDSTNNNTTNNNNKTNWLLDTHWWNTQFHELVVQPTATGVSSLASALLLTDDDMPTAPTGDMILQDEDCPLCCNPMTLADVSYPLHCPSAHCDFNMCTACIQGMQKSDADGYEQASDGSHQVKYHIACPMCRSKYHVPAVVASTLITHSPQHNHHHNNQHHNSNGHSSSSNAQLWEEKKEPSQHDYYYPSTYSNKHPNLIVAYVVLLRQAYSVVHLLQESDSSLSSTQLQKKHEFLQMTTLEELQEASINYQIYVKELEDTKKKQLQHNKKQVPKKIPELDWSLFDQVLMTRDSAAVSFLQKQQNQHQPQPKAWRDPTLFSGWEELMSLPEQEYVTQLLYSNDVTNLAHAAHIMHGVLLGGQPPSDRAVEVLAKFRATAPPPLPSSSSSSLSSYSPASLKPPPPLHPKEVTKLCGRFPLPNHMPRCVVFPAYHPQPGDRPWSPPLPVRFEKPGPNCAPLTVAQVRGVAGRSGLRRGDIVTHVEGEAVHSQEQYDAMVTAIYQDPHRSTPATENDPGLLLMVVVNAHPENARLLHERAQAMKKARVQL